MNDTTNEKVKIYNGFFDQLLPDPDTSMGRIRAIKAEDKRFELYKFIKEITESVPFKAYQERKTEMVQEFLQKQEEEEDEKKRLPPLINNIPGMQLLMMTDSGLEVEKYEINHKDLGESVTEIDMGCCEWLFKFT